MTIEAISSALKRGDKVMCDLGECIGTTPSYTYVSVMNRTRISEYHSTEFEAHEATCRIESTPTPTKRPTKTGPDYMDDGLIIVGD